MLYPIKFRPQYFEKIWGGNKIKTFLKKNVKNLCNCGESWEVSGIDGKVSEVENGFLAENDLTELTEVYMGDLVGDSVFDQFGLTFPLLVKFIDAQRDLSVQVHPDDELAQQRYGTNGKSEMWHVLQAEPGSGLYIGFKKGVQKDDYLRAVEAGNVDQLLNFFPVTAGDTFFIPAGTVHAIGKGVLLAEIQQSSDCTYRIFDWNRTDESGNPRELHTQEALDAIHFDADDDYHLYYEPIVNKSVPLCNSDFFKVNYLKFNGPIEKVYLKIDSFVLYICTEGKMLISYEGENYLLAKGEVIMMPAMATEAILVPDGEATVLEVHL